MLDFTDIPREFYIAAMQKFGDELAWWRLKTEYFPNRKFHEWEHNGLLLKYKKHNGKIFAMSVERI